MPPTGGFLPQFVLHIQTCKSCRRTYLRTSVKEQVTSYQNQQKPSLKYSTAEDLTWVNIMKYNYKNIISCFLVTISGITNWDRHAGVGGWPCWIKGLELHPNISMNFTLFNWPNPSFFKFYSNLVQYLLWYCFLVFSCYVLHLNEKSYYKKKNPSSVFC